jgi:hypothetical protein
VYEIRRWVQVFIWALEKAYGVRGREAFMRFSKRQSKKTDNCLIKNMDAYEIAETMRQELRDNAFAWEEKLRDV